MSLVFTTDDFDAEYERMLEAGVEFHGEPTENPWRPKRCSRTRTGTATT